MAVALVKNEKDDELSEVEESRNEELSTKGDLEETLLKIMKRVEKAFNDQESRSDTLMDYWDIYNCQLGPNQFYAGNSTIFVPIIYDAINARVTRFSNQIFPQSGRYVEVTTENGDIPSAEMALLEHHVRHAKLRTKVVPALIKNGDVEGQYTIYASWVERIRHVVYRAKKPVAAEGVPTSDEVEDIEEVEIIECGPHVEVIADSDFVVVPSTADSLMDALSQGGSVTILRRWTEDKIEQMIDDEQIDKAAGEGLLEEMKIESTSTRVDKQKKMVDAAGIRSDGRGKYVQVYETWTFLDVEDDRRLCRVYYAGDKRVLSARRNPHWSDRLPIFSAPPQKLQGTFKGISRVQAVDTLQYQANDACNEAMDSAAYALLPIIMTDPEKNPRVGTMILSLAAVWETSPNDTQFAKFPELWKDGLEIVASCRAQIFQTLSVNPAQITQSQAGKTKKLNQAEIANEQQVDILTTADAVTILEEDILTPLISFMLEMDHQYRDRPMLVREYGSMGAKANLQEIGPIQMGKAYQFRWFGVEQARNAQQIQQQVGAINVLRGIPPQMYPGYKLNLGPAISQLIENTFGPRLAPLTFETPQDQISVDPQQENQLLLDGFTVPTHPQDDDMQHIQVHRQVLQQDTSGTVRVHMMAHLQQLEQKRQAQMQQQGGKGQPGAPGGGGPGVPGQPRPGATPGAQRPAQGPPGAIHADRMQDPRAMPRPQ
jgi:hypothetical protein